jgi:hypothetical protein
MKFVLNCQHKEDALFKQKASKNILEFEAETLPEVLEEIERFLRGCGYHFEGQLDIIKDE